MILVAVADDQHLVRAGLRAMLDNVDDMALVGEAADGRAAVDLARRERPDVLLMDVRMPVMDGIEATRRIASDPATSAVKVVVLTTFDVDEYVYGALRAGASGFLLKDAPPEQVEIAARLVVSHATAKTHVARIFAKLQARDRAQLVVLAYESGLVQPGST